MTFERKSPLPPGRYWLDVVGSGNAVDFAVWLAENPGIIVEDLELGGQAFGNFAAVLAELGQSLPSPSPEPEPEPEFDPGVIPPLGDDQPPIVFVLFRVPKGFVPTKLDTKFGFPERATDKIHSQADTVHVPEPENPVGDAVGTALAVIEGVAAVLTLKTILELLAKVRSKT